MLYNFAGPDGPDPKGGLVQTSDGAFWGITAGGGSSGEGTIFKVIP